MTICGNVGEVSYNKVNEKKVCNFSIAHNVGKDENKRVLWIDCAAWDGESGRGQASICEAIELKKGDKVTVWSEWITPDAYLTKDGAAVGKIKATVGHIEK